MDKLEKARSEIDIIDAAMAELFAKRMKCVAEIAEYKRGNYLPIIDEKRESEIKSKRVSSYQDPSTRDLYEDFLTETMRISKKYQSRANCGDNAVFVGTGDSGYIVTVKRGALAQLGDIIGTNAKTLVVTDSGIPRKYVKQCLDSFGNADLVTIEQGEQNKTYENYLKIVSALNGKKYTRSDRVVALGGGVIGDMAGFAAATYNRGIAFYNVPTTLLSQVDASVGGKVAVDFNGGKNLLGTFFDPKAVIIDPNVLDTLDQRQFASGASEIIKIALTSDAKLFEKAEQGITRANAEEFIKRAIELKADVVERDPKENGLRRVLNFGHTIGHAIESSAGFGKLLHGECVALGMIPMCSAEVRDRLIPLLDSLGLPTKCEADTESVKEFLIHDKKKHGGKLTTVFVPSVGSYELRETEYDDFADLIDNLLSLIRRQK